MLCTVGRERDLDDCAPLSGATPPQTAAMLALAPHLRPMPQARDGGDTVGGPMVVEFDWLEAHNEVRPR
jgi:hypothetical protein